MFVPWEDHSGEPRFICDVMTEGLAKQLRLYGVDAAAVESKGKGARHLAYRSAIHILYPHTHRMSIHMHSTLMCVFLCLCVSV